MAEDKCLLGIIKKNEKHQLIMPKIRIYSYCKQFTCAKFVDEALTLELQVKMTKSWCFFSLACLQIYNIHMDFKFKIN